MKMSSAMLRIVNIHDLIEHLIRIGDQHCRDTPFRTNWVFYHDALALMTAKEMIAWMVEKNYYKRWILPVNNLGGNDGSLKVYRDRPVGDSPEFMPWDTHLNNDLKLIVVLYHD